MRPLRRTAAALLLGAAAASHALPAQRDTASLPLAARRALTAPGVRWKRQAMPRVDVYAKVGSAAEPLLGRLAARADSAAAHDLAWLGEPAMGPTLRLFLVGSREEMRPLTGTAHGGTSVTDEGTAFLVANDTVGPALRHEIMHLLSWRLWGVPGGRWLSEGLATAAVGPCRGWTPDDVAAALDRAGRLVSFVEMRRDFVVEGERGAAQYLQAASVVEFIRRRYGRDRLRAFWRTGGFGESERSLGASAADVERAWRAEVARRRAPAPWDAMWRSIHARGCE